MGISRRINGHGAAFSLSLFFFTGEKETKSPVRTAENTVRGTDVQGLRLTEHDFYKAKIIYIRRLASVKVGQQGAGCNCPPEVSESRLPPSDFFGGRLANNKRLAFPMDASIGSSKSFVMCKTPGFGEGQACEALPVKGLLVLFLLWKSTGAREKYYITEFLIIYIVF